MSAKYRIIAIGGKHDALLEAKINEYVTRLGRGSLEWVLLPHAAGDEAYVRRAESLAIASKLPDDAQLIVTDERGTELTSPALATTLQHFKQRPGPITLVIGGAYGISEELRQRATLVWSLSPLVFPHQLVRLIVVEQLYRAEMIMIGHPYHHI